MTRPSSADAAESADLIMDSTELRRNVNKIFEWIDSGMKQSPRSIFTDGDARLACEFIEYAVSIMKNRVEKLEIIIKRKDEKYEYKGLGIDLIYLEQFAEEAIKRHEKRRAYRKKGSHE